MTGPPLRFDGRVVVVTGAGRGLGRSYAVAFAERGASVVVNDLGGGLGGGGASEPVAEAVVDEITARGGQAVADAGDVSDPAAAQRLVDTALDAFGRVDVVVNNAGIDRMVRLEDTTPEMLTELFDVHVVGTFNVTRAAWPSLAGQTYGRIVNTTSSAGYFGLGRGLPYAAAKGALHGLTQSLAVEGTRHGITANAVSPFAASRLTTNRLRTMPALLAAIDRVAPPEAVAPAVLWLAHESTDVTGCSFEVGGGAVCRVFVAETPGFAAVGLTPEDLRDHVRDLLASDTFTVPRSGGDERAITAWVASRAADEEDA